MRLESIPKESYKTSKKRDLGMKTIRKYFMATVFVISTAFISQAGIIYYDYSDAPETLSLTSSGWNVYSSGNLFLSTDGINESGAELEISLSAMGIFTFGRRAEISLGNGFAFAQENDVVDLNTHFSTSTESLVSATERGQTDSFDDYLAFLLDAGNGQSLHGWAEVSATASLSDNGRSSSVAISILRMAFNDIENESILVGKFDDAVIPEPAVATLVLGFGIALIGARRVFKR